jgi:hypothetical protein
MLWSASDKRRIVGGARTSFRGIGSGAKAIAPSTVGFRRPGEEGEKSFGFMAQDILGSGPNLKYHER